MKAWAVQDAKARFSELLDASQREGPQLVTRRGVDAAVLVPIDEWRRMKRRARLGLKQLLLADAPRVEALASPRRTLRRRPPAALR